MTRQEYQKQYRLKNADRLRIMRRKYRKKYVSKAKIVAKDGAFGWVCDCESATLNDKAGHFSVVRVTPEKTCIKCGHYALYAPLNSLNTRREVWYTPKHKGEDDVYTLWV